MKYLCSALVLAIALVLSLDHSRAVEARDQAPAFDNYDIRLDASEQAVAALERMRGPKPVRRIIANFKVEYSETLNIAEVVSSNNTEPLATVAGEHGPMYSATSSHTTPTSSASRLSTNFTKPPTIATPTAISHSSGSSST